MKPAFRILILLFLCFRICAEQKSDSIIFTGKSDRNTEIIRNFEKKHTMFNIVCGTGRNVDKVMIYEGIKVNPNFVIGLGVGKMMYSNNASIPVLLDLKYPELLFKKYLSFFEMSAGAGMTWDYYSGLKFNDYMINPAYSFGFPLGRKCFLTIGGDFDLHLIAYYRYTQLLTGVGFRLGFVY